MSEREGDGIDRDKYERDLAERRAERLKQVEQRPPWKPCLHDACTKCYGTGVQKDGSKCAHSISCPCPKCGARRQAVVMQVCGLE